MTDPLRRVPIVSTIVVVLAVAGMIALGIWQLHRAKWKDDLIARFTAAEHLPPVAWPAVPPPDDRLLFRRAKGHCLAVTGWTEEAGRNRAAQPGWRHIAACRTGGAEGPGMLVDAGWSADLDAGAAWKGGPVSGIVTTAPDPQPFLLAWFGPKHVATPMLVAETPAPGLQPSAPPDPNDLPQNHRSYAVQWFAFAAIAAVIYMLAVAKRWRGNNPLPGRERVG